MQEKLLLLGRDHIEYLHYFGQCCTLNMKFSDLGMSCQLFRSTLISFYNNLLLPVFDSYIFWVEFIPNYVGLLNAVGNAAASSVYFSDWSLLTYRSINDYCVFFVSCNSLDSLISSNIFVRIPQYLYKQIMSFVNNFFFASGCFIFILLAY